MPFWPSVLDNFADLSSRLEGRVAWMYLDVKGRVATGIGNDLDTKSGPAPDAEPPDFVYAIPWVHEASGELATRPEVRAAWKRVKGAQAQKDIGGGKPFWEGLTDLRLTREGLKQVFTRKVGEMTSVLEKRFPNVGNWPADAQMGLLAYAWARGPYFRAPKFEAAVNQLIPDFRTAAKESFLSEVGNAPIHSRNVVMAGLFGAAADALRDNLDVSQITWSGFDDFMKKGVAAVSAAAKTEVRRRSRWVLPSLVGAGVVTGAVLYLGRK